jgi:hypothetical protein
MLGLPRIDVRLHHLNFTVVYLRDGAQDLHRFLPFPHRAWDAAIVDDHITAGVRCANNCNLCLLLHLYPHRDLDSSFQLGVLVLREVGIVAASRPGPHAVLEIARVFEIAAGDEGPKALLGREVEVARLPADRRTAVCFDEVHDTSGEDSFPVT